MKSLKSFFVHYISHLEKSTDRTIIPSVTFAFEVVVLAQLAEQWLLKPEFWCSKPINYIEHVDPSLVHSKNEVAIDPSK